jgi:RNA polymerase sigma-70 factor (ECF subfamily)
MRKDRAGTLPHLGAATTTYLDDRHAYASVYDEHAGPVFRAALAVVRDREIAEDVTQDVFLELWRHPHRYDRARGELRPFLLLLARSRALDACRRAATARRARERLEREVVCVAPPSEDAAVAAQRTAAGRVVRAGVRRLPAEQRDAIALAYWGGLSAAEIAASSGAPLGTVKSRVRLGLVRLARDLGGLSGAPAVR